MDFRSIMQLRLKAIECRVQSASRYCRDSMDFEGCVLYENLLNIEAEIQNAIRAYQEAA